MELTEKISTPGHYIFGSSMVSINPLLADNLLEVSETAVHELFHTLALG